MYPKLTLKWAVQVTSLPFLLLKVSSLKNPPSPSTGIMFPSAGDSGSINIIKTLLFILDWGGAPY